MIVIIVVITIFITLNISIKESTIGIYVEKKDERASKGQGHKVKQWGKKTGEL